MKNAPPQFDPYKMKSLKYFFMYYAPLKGTPRQPPIIKSKKRLMIKIRDGLKIIPGRALREKTLINERGKRIKIIPEIASERQIIAEGTKLPPKYILLYYTTYYTAGRISEVLMLRKKDIDFTAIGTQEFVQVTMFTEKNRKNKIRVLPIPITRENEFWYDMLLKRIDQIEETDYLFPEITRTAFAMACRRKILMPIRVYLVDERKISDEYYYPLHPHYLRAARLTHLVEKYGMQADQLMYWAGWSDTRMSEYYVRLSPKSLMNYLYSQLSTGGHVEVTSPSMREIEKAYKNKLKLIPAKIDELMKENKENY